MSTESLELSSELEGLEVKNENERVCQPNRLRAVWRGSLTSKLARLSPDLGNNKKSYKDSLMTLQDFADDLRHRLRGVWRDVEGVDLREIKNNLATYQALFALSLDQKRA
eukprot:1136971-Pelagomonas_calceolata.AAC.6